MIAYQKLSPQNFLKSSKLMAMSLICSLIQLFSKLILSSVSWSGLTRAIICCSQDSLNSILYLTSALPRLSIEILPLGLHIFLKIYANFLSFAILMPQFYYYFFTFFFLGLVGLPWSFIYSLSSRLAGCGGYRFSFCLKLITCLTCSYLAGSQAKSSRLISRLLQVIIASIIIGQLSLPESMLKPRSNNIAARLEQQKRSIIESFLKDYIYGPDGEFLSDIHENEYSSNQTYQGELDAHNKRAGTGIYESAEGYIYLGEWLDDNYHGEGIYIFPDNQRYEGLMERGLRHGEGTFYYLDGRIYKGEWERDKKSGYGIEEGTHTYEGDWANDMKDGQGRYTFENGSYYEGSFQRDQPHGKGVFQNDLIKYEGQFKHGLFSGTGKITYKSGQTIEGIFQNNQIRTGKIIYPNGDTYEGAFEQGEKSGQGEYHYSTGEVYKGAYKKGQKNGTGKIMLANGDSYEGAWQNDLKHGRGVYRWANGDYYEGGFWFDKREGEAIIHYPSGGRYEGYWKNDKKYGEGVLFHNERATKIFNN